MINGELGDFIRSRREQVRPADVGLAAGTRRRTPGLRRAELATLAGISVDYLIRLEQGRDVRPSVQILAALAQALRLTDADRDHLQQLATISQGTELCAHARNAARTVRSTTQAILDQLGPTPAYVVNHLADLLAWNDGYERLVRPLGILDESRPNLLRFTFSDPRARDAYPDWADLADHQVARLHQLRHGDPTADAFADQLTEAAGPEFADRWERRPLAAASGRVTAINHPAVGTLRLAVETLQLPDPDQQYLVVHLPVDTATAVGLDRLAGRRPGALRSVATSAVEVV